MFKKLSLTAATLAVAASTLAPAAADAQRYRRNHDQGYYDQGYNARQYRGDDNYYRYNQPRRCSNGTTGAIIGAIAGGLLGRVIDDRGDHAVGTILGGAGGALAGRAIERDGAKRAEYQGRCYR